MVWGVFCQRGEGSQEPAIAQIPLLDVARADLVAKLYGMRVSHAFQLRHVALPVLGVVEVDDAEKSLPGLPDLLDGGCVVFLESAPIQGRISDVIFHFDSAAHCEVEEALPCS